MHRLAVILTFDGAAAVSSRKVTGEPNLISRPAFSWQSDSRAQTIVFLCTWPFAVGYELAHGNQENLTSGKGGLLWEPRLCLASYSLPLAGV